MQDVQRDIDVFEEASAEEGDEVDVALKRVREIPLEQYLSQEKAAIVKNARENRLIKKKTLVMGVRRNRHKSDDNGTRHAMSNG